MEDTRLENNSVVGYQGNKVVGQGSEFAVSEGEEGQWESQNYTAPAGSKVSNAGEGETQFLSGDTPPRQANGSLSYGSVETDEKHQGNEKRASGDDDGFGSFGSDENKPLLSSEKGAKAPERSRLCGTNLYVYISHFLSAWSDNMWTFAVGLFLVDITPNSLQLVAAFGLTMGTSVLLLGPIIGDWVDSTARLRAAQVSLVLQNLLVAVCAGVIYGFLEFREDVEGWGDWAPYLTYVIIIVLASAANLARIANTIAVEKDWIVEICGSDEDLLANMTSTMRAIDLTAMIVAPIATGQVMSFASNKVGALFIAGWNVTSFFLEYFLLWKVYNTVPALRKRKDFKREDSEDKESFLTSHSIIVDSVGGTHIAAASRRKSSVGDGLASDTKNIAQNGKARPRRKRPNACVRRLQRLFSGVIIIIAGWKTYVRYEVMLSGISLALLYMTVLGFDNVTVGYAYIQGLSEWEVSLMMGGAGLIGIFGSLMYPVFRRCLGLPWTGMVALTLQSITLSMCVVSVWLPGSPFDLDNPNNTKSDCVVLTKIANMSSLTTTTLAPGVSTEPGRNATSLPDETRCYDLLSVGVLMAGIIAARFGLWIADLAITQMFLETVAEHERGIVNGVQQSLNQMMDMIKFGLVIGLPLAPQFGLLVILSFAFVFGGWVLYVVFLIRVPKHLFSQNGVNDNP